MAGPLYQYNPARHNILIGGQLITGFIKGTFATFEQTNDTYTTVPGIDFTTRIKQNDDSGSLTLTLHYTSPGNSIMELYRKLDLNGDLGTFEFLAVDVLNGSEHSAPFCWVVKPPSFNGADDNVQLEWVLNTNSLKFNYQANGLVV